VNTITGWRGCSGKDRQDLEKIRPQLANVPPPRTEASIRFCRRGQALGDHRGDNGLKDVDRPALSRPARTGLNFAFPNTQDRRDSGDIHDVQGGAVQRIAPQPANSTIGQTGITYVFPATISPAAVRISLQPSAPGLHRFRVQIPDTPAIDAHVLVMP
jgi:hypothetical protein